MKALRIGAVDVVEGGVVVMYDDGSYAFYEDAVLMTHLHAEEDRKTPGRVGAAKPVEERMRA